DEVEVLVVGRRRVDVDGAEGVLVQRPDRGALVGVDVLDAQLLALLQEAVGLRGVQPPAARVLVPLGGVDLDALQVPLLGVFFELLEARVAFARVEPAVDDDPVGVLGQQVLEAAVLVDGVEALGVPVVEVRRLEDDLVDVALDEHVLLEVLGRDLEVLLVVPVGLGRGQLVVAVEAVDPALRVLLAPRLPVLAAGVPEMAVGVDDVVLLAILLVRHVAELLFYGTRIARPRTRPASRSWSASSAESSGYCLVCRVTFPAWASTISSARSLYVPTMLPMMFFSP